ncbi:MAG TPA: hypothetical protein VHU84_02470 [Lacipirellulaceae bacterium]|jgi:hypothetical protein|nr:hypothetical protein [Lacipirellulaceae bacterium]
MPKAATLLIAFALCALILPPRPAAGETADQSSAPPSDSESAKPHPKPTTARERAAARRSARDNATKAKREKDRTEWVAKLKARGVEPWPEEDTEQAHADALAKSREKVNDVLANFPGTQLFETDRFLFVSNIPQKQVAPYIASLDKMYDWMCKLYGVPRDHKVWLGGKAPIFAFLNQDEFTAFEDRHYPEARESFHTLSNVYGLSHLSENGEVVISCYRGNDPNDFAQMLVHETSHGFIHRYKTKARLPNWVDEGMADLIGAEMVPASTVVKNREYQAILQISQKRSLGGMLTTERIEAWQYGVASNLTRFLLQSNRDEYVRFIEALKEGQKWDEALKDAYNSRPEELLTAYGRWIKVGNLQP